MFSYLHWITKDEGVKNVNWLPLFLFLVTISGEEKETINTLLCLPKLALMIGPRTDTQFTGGRAT